MKHMRRISLAVALIGAVAASGCGGNKKPASDSGAKGTAGVNFTVTINNTGPGTVVSSPAGINCSPADAPATSRTCSATFASGAAVTLAATPSTGQYFNGWYGGCSGTGACKLFVDVDANGITLSKPVTTDADKYVVAYFSASAQAHTNWAAGHPKIGETNLNCGICHGQNGEGVGLAPACTSCHGKLKPGSTTDLVAHAFGKTQDCGICHKPTGAEHQARYNDFADGINPASTKFAVSNVTFTTAASATPNKFKATVTFNLTKAGSPCVAPADLKQKTVYFVSYDATNKKFPTPSYKQTADVDPDGTIGGSNTSSLNFSLSSMTLANSSTCQYTVVKDGLASDPALASVAPNSFVYGYFGDANVPTLEGNVRPGGHYNLMDNMISFAKIVNGTIGYTSTATVSGCEKCHGAPYSKHGYRQATVAGLNDFVACKACHTDFRRGTDAGWYLNVDNPTKAATTGLDAAAKLQYAYTANVMQDTHNSHAMEFAYPQTMANCVTCHEGKLDLILTDANFNGVVCKSCHATTNTVDLLKRAPSFAGKTASPWGGTAFTSANLGTSLAYHAFNWVDVYDAQHNLVGPAGTIKDGTVYRTCNYCHGDNVRNRTYAADHTFTEVDPATDPTSGAMDGKGAFFSFFGSPTPTYVPLFKDIHSGKIASVYDQTTGAKYLDTVTSKVDSIAVDTAAKTVTVQFSVANAPAGATIVPTVVGALYGFNTKDFLVSGHNSDANKKSILEFTSTSTSNFPARLNVTGSGPWTAVANLSDGATFPSFANGDSTKMELAFLPAVTLADGVTSIAISGISATIDLTVNGPGTPVANQVGKNIVSTAGCNKCHEALGTEFHSPNYGSAGVVGCRVCHSIQNASSHLERQARNIDAFIHAAHSFEKMDLNGNSRSGIPAINFLDPTEYMFRWEEHVDSVYPNFSIQNCQSCHNAGTYDVPNPKASLPGLISGSTDAIASWPTRSVTGLKATVTDAASRACVSCHRVPALKEGNIGELNALEAHATTFGIFTMDADGVNPTAGADAKDLSKVIADLCSAHIVCP
jgi:OmcA/MtrC family decaheme c-type cytochrome